MKTYIYTYRRVKNDVNGNPRHWVTVYRIKKNQPVLLKHDERVGYKGKEQAVYDVIAETERWGSGRHSFESGYNCNGVEMAKREGNIELFHV